MKLYAVVSDAIYKDIGNNLYLVEANSEQEAIKKVKNRDEELDCEFIGQNYEKLSEKNFRIEGCKEI
jgi:DNA-dependent RNA polymerase auxiliary subunit epsilon